jgi:beta-lactamase class A
LVFYSKIDGISLGGWKKVDAISQLDGEYNGQAIPIYLGPMGKKFSSPKPIDIGLIISNQARVDSISYPWYLRIVPTSIFWAHYLTDKVADPEFSRDQGILSSYISANMSGACNIEPKDATLLASGPSLEVVESYYGASCEIGAVYDALSTITPELGGSYKAIVPVDEIAPAVSDATAQNLADSLMQKVGVGFPLTVIGSEQVISSSEVLSWLDFRSDDTSLAYSVNTDRASVFLNDNIAPLINIDPGITTINTYNFIEKSRDVGVTGKVFDVQDTIGDIKGYLDGTNKKASAVFASTPPSIVYSRSYSPADAELSALIAQFDSDHSGVYGVSMVELSDKNRLASYNDTNVFITASTYKLYVAYSTLKRVESGTWSWSDNIVNGHNLSTCFYDMIAYSNNTCAEAILDKVGLINVTNDAHEIGCINTTFLESGGIKTTPSDLMLFLGQLQMGQILNLQSSRDRLIGAMKSNVYRLGIPSGLGEFVVADKVGFLDELLHDAAIVYCPTGTYVLVIMTEGASWSSIASLASQIEALRAE